MQNGISILVVDDDPAMLKMVATGLRGAGYGVRIASTAEQALTTLETLQPAVVIVDLQLPGLHGLDLARRVRENPRTGNAVILVITAHAGAQDAAGAAGCDGFLRKPFNSQTLIRFVAEHIDKKAGPGEPRDTGNGHGSGDPAGAFLEHALEQCRILERDLKFRFPDSAANGTLRRIAERAKEYRLDAVVGLAEKAAARIDALWRDPEGLAADLGALCSQLEALQTASHGPARILAIDDDPDITQLIEALAGKLEAECKTAGDSVEGMRKLEEFRPHLVIIDINLPDASGFEILQQVREKLPDARTIFLTANQEEGDVVRGFELGADDYVTKPVKVGEFVARMKRLMPRAEGRR